MTPRLRFLGVISAVETVSVLVLLANLITVHDPAVARTLGPLHGALYLSVAVTALFAPNLLRSTRIAALLPVLSGPLTMLQIRKEAARR